MTDTTTKLMLQKEDLKMESDEDLYDGVPLHSMSSTTFKPGAYTSVGDCDIEKEITCAQTQAFQARTRKVKVTCRYKQDYLDHSGSADSLIACDSDVYIDRNCSTHPDSRYIMPIAPPLDEHTSHHVIFLSHPSNEAFVSDVTARLEAPFLGFRCWFKDRVVANGHQSLHSNKVKGYLKAIIVLSQEFVTDIWNNDDVSLHAISQQETGALLGVAMVLLLDGSEVPQSLRGVVCIDTRLPGWWTRLIAHLCSYETSIKPNTDNKLSISSSFITSPSVATSNGYLLHSIKSRCIFCGQEIVDISECPKEFNKNGIKVPVDEYQCALEHLLADSRFRCHVCCYHVPLSILCFTLLLSACLVLIPLLESQLAFQVEENGLQYVHAVLVWLFFLTVYLIVLHISRKKMKTSTYAKLVFVNKLLSKYKVLACVENLGLADCNKYYLHFFYFDLGPCLTYLQELLAALHDTAPSCSSASGDPHQDFQGELALSIDCDTQLHGDQSRLDTSFTNRTIQSRAAALIFERSGEYLSQLITKRLDTPLNIRHMSNYPCPCQYVEHSAFKMQS